jgi:putative ABC transport system ATP-binding protein
MTTRHDTPPILRVHALHKTFASIAGPLKILQNISFSIAKGETVAITGPSGSGKSTLLSLCAGLDRPTSGDVWLANQHLSRLSSEDAARVRRNNVGFVFQNFQLLAALTAFENISVPLGLRGEKINTSACMKLLERLGLEARSDHYPQQLSGGEQQRVALARAFAGKPSVLFCDEPTGNLDEESAKQVADAIFSLNVEYETTIVLVTHSDELARRCSRILSLKHGVLAQVCS